MGAALAPIQLGFGRCSSSSARPVWKSRLLDEFKSTAAMDLDGSAQDATSTKARRPISCSDLLRPLFGGGLEGTAAENAEAFARSRGAFAPALGPWLPLAGLVLDVDVGLDTGGGRASSPRSGGHASTASWRNCWTHSSLRPRSSCWKTCTGSTKLRPSCFGTSARPMRRGRGQSAARDARARTGS